MLTSLMYAEIMVNLENQQQEKMKFLIGLINPNQALEKVSSVN